MQRKLALLVVVALCCLAVAVASRDADGLFKKKKEAKKVKVEKKADKSSNHMSPCGLPMKTGPCKAKMTRWYYDAKEGCKKFNYGGCKGNGNNFKTRSACTKTCGKSPNDSKVTLPKKKPSKDAKTGQCVLDLPKIPSRCAGNKFECQKNHIRHYCAVRQNVCRKVKKRCIKTKRTCNKWSRISKRHCAKWEDQKKCTPVRYYRWHWTRGARKRKCKYFFKYKTKMVAKKVLSRRVCVKYKKFRYLSKRNRKKCVTKYIKKKKCTPARTVKRKVGATKEKIHGCKPKEGKSCERVKYKYKNVTIPRTCKMVKSKEKKKVCRRTRVWRETKKCVKRQAHLKTVKVPKKVKVPGRRCGKWYRPKVRTKQLRKINRCQTKKVCKQRRTSRRTICVRKRNTCEEMSNVCVSWKSTCKETKPWCTRVTRFCGNTQAARAKIYAGRLTRKAERLAKKCGTKRHDCRRKLEACYKRCSKDGDCRKKCDKRHKATEKKCWESNCACKNAESLIKLARRVKKAQRVDV